MALTKLSSDLNNISHLDTEPNDIGGLSAEQLKAKFDEGPNAIKAYINDTLTKEIDEQKADKSEVRDIVLGQIPNGTITAEKLSTEINTSINSKTPNALPDDVATAFGLSGNPQVKDALTKLGAAALRKTSGTPLSNIAVGSTFYIAETASGAVARFVKIATSYEGTTGTLIVRASPLTSLAWDSGSAVYGSSSLDAYLNGTYFNSLSTDLKNSIITANVKAYVTSVYQSGSITTLQRKIFIPSAREISTMNTLDGSYISALNSAIGTSSNTWSRTPGPTDPARATTTYGSDDIKTAQHDIFPMFILPSNFVVNVTNSLVDMGGADFPLPYAKIATGSYTGTGTYGVNNKNSIMLPFRPYLVFIKSDYAGAGGTSFAMVNGNNSVAIWEVGMGFNTDGGKYAKLEWASNGVKWYSDVNSSGQLNNSGMIFTYVAIG